MSVTCTVKSGQVTGQEMTMVSPMRSDAHSLRRSRPSYVFFTRLDVGKPRFFYRLVNFHLFQSGDYFNLCLFFIGPKMAKEEKV